MVTPRVRLVLACLFACVALSVPAAPRGYMGVALSAADVPDLPEGSGGPYEVAGEVSYLVPGATAAQAGLEFGDLLLAIDGVGFTRDDGGPPAQLRAALKGRLQGDRVTVTYL
jgi:S1-C subfamily serine protease